MNSPFKRWWTCTILIFLLHVSQCSGQQCNPGDREALLEFKAGFTVNELYFQTWKEGTNCCEWNGVTCTSTGRVKSLRIYNPFAHGGPSGVAERNTSYHAVAGVTLGNLSELRSLELSSILFNGPMPDTFFKLKKLESLTMSFNNFSDSLSPSIGAATSLKYLRVDGQGYWWPFSPKIPTPIPASFCNLVKLQRLDLTSFGLTGTIPSCVCRFTRLTELDLSRNSLVSEIPDCIGYSLRKLQRLHLASNKFTGPLPPMLGGLTKLDTLDLSENKFSGGIPPEIGNLVNMYFLNLGNNSCSGAVPAALGRLKKLSYLDLSLNSLTQIAPELGQLVKVSSLSLASNKLQGTLPPEIGNTGSKGEYSLSLDISNNMLSGSIPNIFGSGKFSTFSAANNRFSGGFPLTLAMIDSVDLSNNFLEDLKQVGSLSPAPKIHSLNLGNNRFSGPVPKWFQDLVASSSGLSYFDVSLNNFTGPVPASFLGLPNLWNLNASYNSFNGQLPTQSFTPGFGFLDLSHNRISGPITSTFFASLIKAMHLDLSFNELSGPLPANSGDFTDLNYLDLSHNRLNGTVPASIEKIPLLSYLNLSYNMFTGRVPSKP